MGDFSCTCRFFFVPLQPQRFYVMKKIIVLLLALMPFVGVEAESQKSKVESQKPANKETVVLSCDLHCQGCCDKVMKNIAFEKGVKDIVCDLRTKTVTVTFDPRKTDVPTLLKAFERIKKPAKEVGKG